MADGSSEVKNNTSVYQEIRDLLALGLSGNELKAALAYLLEKDESTRQVRGKTQEELRAVAGMSRTRFMDATSKLKSRGLVAVQKHRNGPATISVGRPGNRDVPNAERPGFGTSRKCDLGRPAFRDLGRPGNRDNVIYTAPVVGSSTAPECARESSADELARQAYERGLEIKGGKVAKSARAVVAAQGELDGSKGITFADGKLTVDDSTAAEISRDFPGLDIAYVCTRAAPDLARVNWPTRSQAMAVLRKWAGILSQDAAKNGKRLKPAAPPVTEPTAEELEKIRAANAALDQQSIRRRKSCEAQATSSDPSPSNSNQPLKADTTRRVLAVRPTDLHPASAESVFQF